MVPKLNPCLTLSGSVGINVLWTHSLLWWLVNFYTPAPRRGRRVYCFTSVLPSVQDIFRRIFLSSCWWQKSDIWSQASYRYTILWVALQEVGIWWVQKRFPRYRVPIWSLWPNIRSLSSIVAEKNVTKNVHIRSMSTKTNSLSFRPSKIFFVAFFSVAVDGRNLIFGHKHHIGIPYCG
jgi:hypothetical protein